MAVLGSFNQTPIERKRYRIDYSDWLQGDEVLNSISFTTAPAPSSPVAAVDAYAIDADKKHVTCFVSGGVDLETYRIHILAITSLDQHKEDEAIFNIRDLP